MTTLAPYTDDQLRRLIEKKDPELGEAAERELARRGLISTPETIAELAKSRKKYSRYARNADGDWGFTAKSRLSR